MQDIHEQIDIYNSKYKILGIKPYLTLKFDKETNGASITSFNIDNVTNVVAIEIPDFVTRVEKEAFSRKNTTDYIIKGLNNIQIIDPLGFNNGSSPCKCLISEPVMLNKIKVAPNSFRNIHFNELHAIGKQDILTNNAIHTLIISDNYAGRLRYQITNKLVCNQRQLDKYIIGIINNNAWDYGTLLHRFYSTLNAIENNDRVDVEKVWDILLKFFAKESNSSKQIIVIDENFIRKEDIKRFEHTCVKFV